MFDETKKNDIKNKKQNTKKRLQILAFVYTCLMGFPVSNISIQTFTCAIFFENLFHIIIVKINSHHFHVTVKIYGYVYDFCNHKVHEKRNFISCIVHNFYGFDIFRTERYTLVSLKNKRFKH